MIIPTGYAQANFIFSGVAAPTGAQMTLGLDVDGTSASPALTAQNCADVWGATLRGLQSSSITLAQVLVKYGPNQTGPSAIVSPNLAGQATAGTEVPNTALLVRKNTGLGGRAGRGRMYVPGLPEGNFNSSGDMTSAQLALWQTECNDFLAGFLALNLIPVLLHGAGSPIEQPLPITSFSAQGRASTQRRRLRR